MSVQYILPLGCQVKCLDGELFLSLAEARYVVDRWRLDYNHHRPHSSLGNIPPAEFATRCIPSAVATLQPPEYAEVT